VSSELRACVKATRAIVVTTPSWSTCSRADAFVAGMSPEVCKRDCAHAVLALLY
jgi:hypothetical protein